MPIAEKRRASRPADTAATEVPITGWPVASAARVAAFHAEARTGARRPGCLSSSVVADMP
jgi:hypothetical protein